VNVIGQVLYRAKVNSNKALYDVNGLANGVYLVRIITVSDSIYQRKIVKKMAN